MTKEELIEELTEKIMELVHDDSRISGFRCGSYMNQAQYRCEGEIQGALDGYISGVRQ